MTIDKFVRRSRIIEAHVAEIVRWSKPARFGSLLHPVNPHFRAVVIAQENLLNAVERLLETCPVWQIGDGVHTSYQPHSRALGTAVVPGKAREHRLQRASLRQSSIASQSKEPFGGEARQNSEHQPPSSPP